MARRALDVAQLSVLQALRPVLQRSRADSRPVRIGCSGGADSMALTAAAAHLVARELADCQLEVVVVDHGLQEASAELTASVVERCQRLGLAARGVRVDVDVDSPLGLEAAAREARYAALTSDFAGDLDLAHSLDDQAETVLLGLARGSGTRSLAGMAPESWLGATRVLRPLLGLRRTQLRQAAQAWGVTIWDDPHNQMSDFRRVRVRQQVLPTMVDELGPQVIAALARTADLARADADALDGIARELLPDPLPDQLAVDILTSQPLAIASRILRRWLIQHDVVEPSAQHITAVLALVTDWHGQLGVDLPGGIRVWRAAGKLNARAL